MDINHKRILILGAYGQVGQAITRMILRHFQPKQLVLSSLYKQEADEIAALAREWSGTFYSGHEVEIIAEAGNMMLSSELQELYRRLKSGEDVEAEYADKYVRFIFREYNEFSPVEKREIFLYRMLAEYKPEIVIDCVNTATGLAYQDIFSLGKEYMKAKDRAVELGHECPHAICERVPFCERLLMSTSLPGLVRHIEILNDGMAAAKTEIYLKVGTTGTGGMGLNIPYTHSESKPSRTLMSKSSLGGAASLLYLLMNRTAGGPVIKEIKPASLIGWKSIGYGEIKKHGQPIPLYDCSLDQGYPLAGGGADFDVPPASATGANLEGVYIDTGENGVFSCAEFETITSLEQMELVTAEDVARAAVEEIRGESTGFDVVGALSAVVQDSTYRGGVMRNMALGQLDLLEQEHGEGSVAYEILGPPRLSKLLWEAQLIRQHGGLSRLLAPVFAPGLELDNRLELFDKAFAPAQVCEQIASGLAGDAQTRARMISIGLPICTPEMRLLFGPTVALMRAYPDTSLNEIMADPQRRQFFLENGAVVVMPGNLERWKARIASGIRYHFLAREGGEEITGSGTDYRNIFTVRRGDSHSAVAGVDLQIGELIGWIFVMEEHGSRRRHFFTPDEPMA